MRYLIIAFIVSILTCFSFPCYANAPIGYIGLFTDELHDVWCVQGEPYYWIEVWVCCLPSYQGQICAEFALSFPSNVLLSTVEGNYAILAVTLPGCIHCEGNICKLSCCYMQCQYDWHWIIRRGMFVADQTPSYCEIVPHPDIGTYQFANCLEGYPSEPCIKYTNFYINYNPSDPECSGTSMQEKSWGAIKSLYR